MLKASNARGWSGEPGMNLLYAYAGVQSSVRVLYRGGKNDGVEQAYPVESGCPHADLMSLAATNGQLDFSARGGSAARLGRLGARRAIGQNSAG